MYERSAIVLERYFEKLLGFAKTNNVKQNFKNYCDLFEKFNLLQTANSEEFSAIEEFQAAENEIEDIQASEEKLYKKSAKLEYNRDLVFGDISQKPEEIEKCMQKIEGDLNKNHDAFVKLRERFVEAVRNYNEKKSALAKCKKTRRNAENEYNAAFELAQQNLENIEAEYIEIGKAFVTDENKEELISTMASNGKDEKIPFNNAVITAATGLGFDIYEKEEECYLDAYKMATKLIKELLDGAVSIEAHEKTIRNINVKINFFNAEKDYLVQFLDYERVTAIYGKRSHRTLMQEACEKFETDVKQIDNLYQLLLREISNKSTKKAYKELYNKSYLVDMEEKDAKLKKEKNRMNMSVGTIMSSNYWRIEGIKNIYTVFYKDVSNVFGKDLDEFEVPDEQDDDAVAEMAKPETIEEETTVEVAKVVEEKPVKKEKTETIQEIVEEPVIEDTRKKIVLQKAQKKVSKFTRRIVDEEPEQIVDEEPVVEIEPVTELAVEETKSEVVDQIAEEISEVEEGKIVAFEEIKEKAKKAEPEIEIIEEPKADKKKKATKKKEEKPKKEKKSKKSDKAEKEEKAEKKEKKERKGKLLKGKKEENVAAAVVLEEEVQAPEQTSEVEEHDIFGEKYRDIEKKIAELDDLDDFEELKIQEELATKIESITAETPKETKKASKAKKAEKIESTEVVETVKEKPAKKEKVEVIEAIEEPKAEVKKASKAKRAIKKPEVKMEKVEKPKEEIAKKAEKAKVETPKVEKVAKAEVAEKVEEKKTTKNAQKAETLKQETKKAPAKSKKIIEEELSQDEINEEVPYDDEESIFDMMSNDVDEDIIDFSEIGKARVKAKSRKKEKEKEKKSGIFENLIKLNSKEKKAVKS